MILHLLHLVILMLENMRPSGASQSGFIMDLYLGCWWKCEIFMRCVPIGKVGMEDTM